MTLENKPTGCSLHIAVDSSAGLFSTSFGENEKHQPKVSLKGGDKCISSLRYEVTQVIPGSIGQMQMFIWYDSEWARFKPPAGLGF